MSESPYQPPSAISFLRAPQLRTDYGFRLAFSLFWRVILLQCFAVWAVDALRYVHFDIGRFRHVAICIVLALISSLPLLFTKRGVLFFLFGDRIALAAAAWRKFHWLFAAYYGVMAVWNLGLVYALVIMPREIRIAGSLTSLFLFFVIMPRMLRKETDVK